MGGCVLHEAAGLAPSSDWLRRFAVIGAVCLLTSASADGAGAAVYRWVDDQGKVHYAEVVPQQYLGAARRVDAAANEPSAEQRRDALARARQQKSQAAAMAAERHGSPASAANAPSAASAAAASQAAGKRPAQTPDDQTDCKTWQRLYKESIECFGPFRTVRGATKPEAFEVCNVVAEPPASRCRVLIP